MNLENYYWYFDKYIGNYYCYQIINYALKQNKDRASIGGLNKRDLIANPLSPSELKALKKTRNSYITWLDEHWLYRLLQPYIHLANQNAKWNVQWDWSESVQFTHYKLNQHYNWHCDSNPKPYSSGKIRKLSAVVALTDAQDYTGGELNFDFRNETKKRIYLCEEIKRRGTIIVFPSFVWHKVNPVTQGTRYSLVMWSLGKPYV